MRSEGLGQLVASLLDILSSASRYSTITSQVNNSDADQRVSPACIVY